MREGAHGTAGNHMPKEFKRTDRVAGQMQREIAQLVQTEVKDPRLGMVTISAVEVTRDLAHAKVFFTVMGGASDQREVAGNVLNGAGAYLRHLLGERMRVRIVPALHFIYDESVERGISLDRLIEAAVASDKSDKDS